MKAQIAPAIKMDGEVIVDGNHQYIAAKILGREINVDPGVLTSYKESKVKPVADLKITPNEYRW